MGDRSTLRRRWGGRPLTVQPHSTAKSRKRGPLDFLLRLVAGQFQWTTCELRLPAFAFTVTSDHLTIGRLRVQLSVASLQQGGGSNVG